MYYVDLNCDLGESFGNYTIGLDDQVIPYLSSANVACGYHAGDPLVMKETLSLCKTHAVSAGAHPGFPDLMGFGRRNMNCSPKEIKAYIQYQLGALKAMALAEGISLQHVKPHGALYNMAGKNKAMAAAICEGIYEVDSSLILLGLYGSQMIAAAKETGLAFASEVFADRAYEEDGSLVARSKPGSVITDEETAIRRVLTMVKEQKVTAITGKEIPIEADSICVHGDNIHALEFVRRIRKTLESEGIVIANLTQVFNQKNKIHLGDD